MSHHHTIKKNLGHGAMDCIFSWYVMTIIHAMKNKTFLKKIINFCFKFCQQKILVSFIAIICTCLYAIFVYGASMYIHVIYISAHIHQNLNQNLMELYQGFNHQITSSFNNILLLLLCLT